MTEPGPAAEAAHHRAADWHPSRDAGAILKSALDAVTGARAREHGPARQTFAKVATLWNAYLEVRREPAAPLGPSDIAELLLLLKVARAQSGRHSVDDFVDQAGYAGLAGALAEAEVKGDGW
jgi:hypothetical protein